MDNSLLTLENYAQIINRNSLHASLHRLLTQTQRLGWKFWFSASQETISIEIDKLIVAEFAAQYTALYAAVAIIGALIKAGYLNEAPAQDASVQDKQTNVAEARKQHIQRLIERAHKIGTIVHDRGKDGFSYKRPRFLIPGTRYKFYFYVSNAYDTSRKQRSAKYAFGPNELGELEKWIAHDEAIFAECNQKYSV